MPWTLLILLALPPPLPPDYSLPFEAGRTVVVLQGYAGPWGHTGHAEFAYDFTAEIGTAVHAARAGVVFKTEARFADGNRTPGQENFVFIRHADGTFGRYYHLTLQGASVTVGHKVRRGELIARSGDTGASAGPHLHFDVTRKCPEWGCQTIPIAVSGTNENPLRGGRSYTASPIRDDDMKR
jgi:murein DD-endopeptidase MepM/ murein hydrolase activator NlpD